jgi:hypothetical protein
MPLSGPEGFFSFFLSSSDVLAVHSIVLPFIVLPFSSFSAFFFRFLLPGAFLRACVRPFPFSVLARRFSLAMSVGNVGRMGMTSFSA